MSQENAGTAILNSPSDAEKAVKQLQRSGFNLKKLSIIAKDYHAEDRVAGFYNAGNRAELWGQQSAFWGGMWCLLFGSAFLLVPGMGLVVVAGPMVTSIISGLERAVVLGSLGALGAALYSVGIPRDNVPRFETAINSDKYVLVVHGTVVEVAQAREVLTSMGYEVQVHCAYIPA